MKKLMTYEEMHNIIQEMLAVQRELQESQLALKEGQVDLREEFRASQAEFRASQAEFRASQAEFRTSQAEFRASQEVQREVLNDLIQRYGDLAEHSTRQREILDRLIGYSLTNESDHLDLDEKLRALEARMDARMKRLEA